MTEKRATGQWGEDTAARYLLKQGYTLLERNFFCRYGEIDLIARNGDSIVFVEVKTRMPGSMTEGRESVGYGKQKKLRATALFYLTRLPDNTPARFDVIEIIGNSRRVERIEHIRDAF